MGLFRKLGILVVVTSPKWSPRLVTTLVSGVDQRQTVDTRVATARSGQRQRLNKT